MVAFYPRQLAPWPSQSGALTMSWRVISTESICRPCTPTSSAAWMPRDVLRRWNWGSQGASISATWQSTRPVGAWPRETKHGRQSSVVSGGRQWLRFQSYRGSGKSRSTDQGHIRGRLPAHAHIRRHSARAYGFSKHQTKKYTATASLVFSNNQLGQQVAGLPVASSNNQLALQNTNLKLVQLGDMAAKTAGLLGQGLTKERVSEELSVSAQGESNIVNVAATGRTLDVLVAGAALPPNPGELIESHAMEVLLEGVRSAYDLVVIDTPPLTAVTVEDQLGGGAARLDAELLKGGGEMVLDVALAHEQLARDLGVGEGAC